MERNHNLHGSLWVDQKDFAERLSRRFKGLWNEKFHGWNVECPYCPKHENNRKGKQRKRGARIIEGSNGGWMLQCAICSSDGRDTAGVSLSKLLKEHDVFFSDIVIKKRNSFFCITFSCIYSFF